LKILTLILLCITLLQAREFTVASYNVENLFDLNKDGTEYSSYEPYRHGWNHKTYTKKLTNIAHVIADINADIIGLIEIENQYVLKELIKQVKLKSSTYPYYAIANKRKGAVRVALLSKFPIKSTREIRPKVGSRNILKVTLDIEGNELIVYVNHWKSKRGPESLRIHYAKALKKDIDQLSDGSDFIIIGDLNANYDEHKTILKKRNRRLNDTKGLTSINHIIKTTKNDQLVDENFLKSQKSNEYLYNLWLETTQKRRFSTKSKKYTNSHDHIIVSKALYDKRGIRYIDNSFDRFYKKYLFTQKGYTNRWQYKRKKHQGQGYSDHLPIVARFQAH
jgi:predicted extracellular nuclease